MSGTSHFSSMRQRAAYENAKAFYGRAVKAMDDLTRAVKEGEDPEGYDTEIERMWEAFEHASTYLVELFIQDDAVEEQERILRDAGLIKGLRHEFVFSGVTLANTDDKKPDE